MKGFPEDYEVIPGPSAERRTLNVEPEAMLDAALACEPGEGYTLEFENAADLGAYRNRLTAAMSVAARRAQRDLNPDDPGWGTHPWKGVSIRAVTAGGPFRLWVGKPRLPVIVNPEKEDR